MRRGVLTLAIAAGVAIAVYLAYQQANRSPYALEIDAIRDVTDVGVQYRIRMTNVGTQQLTGIIVELGTNDVQKKPFLEPGQSYYFYPEPETNTSSVKVRTNEGIVMVATFSLEFLLAYFGETFLAIHYIQKD